ncbi:hypothetical protein GGR56DRAFT_569675 [Xylariaceae sp. FL0804]|nr:hypothetical protein GGR56DRAFT_569675 [Xylariaceae sp. FL0804]
MSAPRTAVRGAANGISHNRCLGCVPATRRSACLELLGRRAVLIPLDARQKRYYAFPSGKKSDEARKISRGVILRALRQGLDFRPLFRSFRGQGLKKLYRQSPEELVLAIALLCGMAVVIVYLVYIYFDYFQSEQFTAFPPEIAQTLRKALYYDRIQPDNQMALKYYKMAVQQCIELGLDPFSDKFMGLRIQIAAWLEKIGSYQNAIDALEALLGDCKGWLEKLDQSARDGLVDNDGHLLDGGKDSQTSEAAQDAPADSTLALENLWAKRTRVLAKSVAISVKLGELYADEHVLQGDSAGECLVWAVETALKELQRRHVDGVKKDEGEWISPEEMGGALEALANHYESKSLHYLAAPLYLQAISMSPTDSCHTAVLMNNLAISLAQQPVKSPLEVPRPPVSGKPDDAPSQAPTRATLLAGARSWALHAQGISQKVEGENRTEECDHACATALSNLGDITAMMGDSVEAKKWFEESLALSRKLGFEPGIVQSQEGLKRITQSS